MKVADFIPPILLKLAAHTGQPREAYNRYEDALRACGVSDYESTSIADVVRKKTRKIANGQFDPQSSAPILSVANLSLGIAVAASRAWRETEEMRILDVGGACGAHYFCARATLPLYRLRWCVLETEVMSMHAQEFAGCNLKFVSSFAEAVDWLGGIDLLHASSVLQYFPAPLEALRNLTATGAHTIMLSRLPLTDGPQFSIVQKSKLGSNGPGPIPEDVQDRTVAYPVSFANRKEFEDIIAIHYDIAATYWDSGGNYRTPKGLIPGRTYLLTRRKTD